MSNLTVQLKNTAGEVVQEAQIVVSEGDKLIMQFPDDMPIEKAHAVYKTLLHSLESSSAKLIGIPENITFKVISFKGF